ncbi:hypothetical protein JCM15519_07180 [Fundidesulfovibrio butyratiphilus]
MICPKCGKGNLKVVPGRTLNETPGETIQERACDNCDFKGEVTAVVTAELVRHERRGRPRKAEVRQ